MEDTDQIACVLSTAPGHKTHWKQTTILLPSTTGFPVGANTPIDCSITLAADEFNERRYNLTVNMGDDDEEPEEEEEVIEEKHAEDCECGRCLLIRKMEEQYTK
jgi:hypothetical protein